MSNNKLLIYQYKHNTFKPAIMLFSEFKCFFKSKIPHISFKRYLIFKLL